VHEAQERFVLAVPPESIAEFESTCERDAARPPWSGIVTGAGAWPRGRQFRNEPVEMELSVLSANRRA